MRLPPGHLMPFMPLTQQAQKVVTLLLERLILISKGKSSCFHKTKARKPVSGSQGFPGPLIILPCPILVKINGKLQQPEKAGQLWIWIRQERRFGSLHQGKNPNQLRFWMRGKKKYIMGSRRNLINDYRNENYSSFTYFLLACDMNEFICVC